MAINVGLDLGKSSIKFVTAAGPGEIPAWLARGRITQVVGQSNEAGGLSYNGKDYIVGKDAILGNGFSWSSTEDKDDLRNLLFTLSALGRLGITDANVVTGLPVTAAGSPAAVERMKGLIEGIHEVSIGGKEMSINIRGVGILAEPLGAYFSMVLDAAAKPVASPYFHELIGIVDIGYRTVDVVALEGGKLATTKDSTLTGITNLYDRVSKLIEADQGKLRPNEAVKVHAWLIGGCQEPLKIGGEYVRSNMPSEVARLKTELAGQIMDEVKSLLANIRPDRILITGGGAALLRGELSRINPRLMYHHNPKFANAIGFYRAACAKNSQ